MGGGTGSGAAPVVAQVAEDLGALTVAVVTKPFEFEGKQRMKNADEGLSELRPCVDTILTIPNEKLFDVVDENTTLSQSFRIADDVLRQGVQGISDIITVPGLVNVDFADVSTVMKGQGLALMGTASARGDGRAKKAAEGAVSSPLLEDVRVEGALGVLINITGGPSLTLTEVREAALVVYEVAHTDANIILGAVIDDRLDQDVRVTVIATGFDGSGEETSVSTPGDQVEEDIKIMEESSETDNKFSEDAGLGDLLEDFEDLPPLFKKMLERKD